jgi:hypothetical protein
VPALLRRTAFRVWEGDRFTAHEMPSRATTSCALESFLTAWRHKDLQQRPLRAGIWSSTLTSTKPCMSPRQENCVWRMRRGPRLTKRCPYDQNHGGPGRQQNHGRYRHACTRTWLLPRPITILIELPCMGVTRRGLERDSCKPLLGRGGRR